MGKMLTFSIKKIYPKSIIIDVAGKGQNSISDTDFSEKWKFNKENFMYDDVECKKYIQKVYGPTVFIDSDMILINNIDDFIKIKDFDFSVTKRQRKSMFKKLNYDSHKKKFPQLTNKTLGETMPYNGGIYYSKNIETLEFMLEAFKNMGGEYFEWYGNQIALYEMVKSKKFKVKIFEDEIYNYTPSDIGESHLGRKILHFKGTKRYLYIPFFKKIFGETVFKQLFNL